MNKSDLKNVLSEKFQMLYDYVLAQDADQFEVHHTPEKWSTGQHVDHLRKSTKALNFGLYMNPLVLWFKFGKINRTTRSYDEVKQLYEDKLGGGVRAPKKYTPKEITNDRKEEVMKWLGEERDRMLAFVDKKSEKQLNSYCIPHPVLGKMSFGEFIYWTAVHTEHHLNLIKKYNGVSVTSK